MHAQPLVFLPAPGSGLPTSTSLWFLWFSYQQLGALWVRSLDAAAASLGGQELACRPPASAPAGTGGHWRQRAGPAVCTQVGGPTFAGTVKAGPEVPGLCASAPKPVLKLCLRHQACVEAVPEAPSLCASAPKLGGLCARTVEAGPEDPQEQRANHAEHVVEVGGAPLRVLHAVGGLPARQHKRHGQAVVRACAWVWGQDTAHMNDTDPLWLGCQRWEGCTGEREVHRGWERCTGDGSGAQGMRGVHRGWEGCTGDERGGSLVACGRMTGKGRAGAGVSCAFDYLPARSIGEAEHLRNEGHCPTTTGNALIAPHVGGPLPVPQYCT